MASDAHEEIGAVVPTKEAHIAMCPGCDNPSLASDLPTDSAAMQCPRCGTFLRSKDIWTFERVAGEDDV